MKPLTLEWVAKAEADFTTAPRELNAADAPNFDAVGFHGQQCAEKFLKALLAELGARIPLTHDLGALIDLLFPAAPSWTSSRADADSLSDLAVEVRYPGMCIDALTARQALDAATRIRSAVRLSLGLPE